MDNDKLRLYEFILDHFSQGELKELCFPLRVVYDDLEGVTRKDKARELVEYMARRKRLAELEAAVNAERPDAYRDAFPARAVPPAAADRRVHEKTGIELIGVPAGLFLYGDDQKKVELPEYRIGRYPVTNAQFARFVQAVAYRTTAESEGFGWGWTGKKWGEIKGATWRRPRGRGSAIDGKDDHPVVQVSWHDARSFCDWAGLALPSKEQWEKAARGTDGRVWPWGDDPPTAGRCNFNMNAGDTTPVGRYSPQGDSPYGCADMAGNVAEWASLSSDESAARGVRGGHWAIEPQSTLAAFGYDTVPHFRNNMIGFRVVHAEMAR